MQDIRLGTDNVLFHKEKYYSPTTHQSYLAELPRGYRGQYGPGIQAVVLTFYYGMQASEPKILEFLENVGIRISKGEISHWLIQDRENFHVLFPWVIQGIFFDNISKNGSFWRKL